MMDDNERNLLNIHEADLRRQAAQLDRIETKLDEVLLFINKADALIGVFSGGKYKGIAAILKAKL